MSLTCLNVGISGTYQLAERVVQADQPLIEEILGQSHLHAATIRTARSRKRLRSPHPQMPLRKLLTQTHILIRFLAWPFPH